MAALVPISRVIIFPFQSLSLKTVGTVSLARLTRGWPAMLFGKVIELVPLSFLPPFLNFLNQ